MDRRPGEDCPAQTKRLRADLGLTQIALTETLGVLVPTINRRVDGESRPSQLPGIQIPIDAQKDPEYPFPVLLGHRASHAGARTDSTVSAARSLRSQDASHRRPVFDRFCCLGGEPEEPD